MSAWDRSWVYAGTIVALLLTQWAIREQFLKYDQEVFWLSALLSSIAAGLAYWLLRSIAETRSKIDVLIEDGTHRNNIRDVEDRLDELERLKRRDLITPEEYAAKRQEILKDL